MLASRLAILAVGIKHKLIQLLILESDLSVGFNSEIGRLKSWSVKGCNLLGLLDESG